MKTRKHHHPAFQPVSCRYGSPMGRRTLPPESPCRLRLKRAAMVDSDYDSGGAYWGATPGTAIFCGWNRDAIATDGNPGAFVYVRAASRTEAAALVLAECPEGTTCQ